MDIRPTRLALCRLRENPIGEVYTAPSDVELDERNIFQPDIYYVGKERYGILTRQGASGSPDLIVEILSPSTARLDRERKREIYFRFGVRELWLINVRQLQVEIYSPGKTEDAQAIILRAGETLNSPLLPGLDIEVREALGGGIVREA